MMRSMYSAVSGLRVHQTKMDVIGNNIANINTVGYKRQSVTFQEVFSEVIRGASAPQGGRGGTNPQQIGLGVSVGSINTIHTKGAAQRTDNPEDLMIDGEGFFVVSADPNLENRYYTRAGNFTLDRDGNLVTADGYKVLGYRIDENGDLTSEVVPIQVMRSETVAPTATSRIEFRG
ncbi:MAG: flagellar hook-basal body complex protein, partial [Tissierellia bacterium]|nr:flagellar hook-basal body complex protein [Tissierellia bacterium]